MKLIINDKVSSYQKNCLLRAFEERNKTEWPLSLEQYGFNCKNMDEVLTHIRYDQLFDHMPPSFSIE